MAEHLQGTVDRVTFHNADNGFAVLRVSVRGRRDPLTVVGHLASVVPGEFLEATGDWTQDATHGLQFKATQMRTLPPHTREGIERFLGSGLIKGIGPHYARKIVEVFGERTLSVIDESPSFLQQIKGIGRQRLQRIRESWQQQKVVRDLMIFLQTHGVGTARAVRIYKTYGEQALEVVRTNPYRLAADIWGVGFQTADQLARRLGVDPTSPDRARAALRYVLQELSGDGHVGYPEEGVIEAVIQLTQIEEGVVRTAIEEERAAEEVVREPGGDEPWLYLKPLFLAELNVARAIHEQRRGEHPLRGRPIDELTARAEQTMDLSLAESQREAIRQSALHKVLVVTGGPGVGKTTIVRGLLQVFLGAGLRCALCAPTGRAAKRLSESTGRDARTIHRLLEFDAGVGGFKRNRDHTLDLDLLVVDESSMVDIVLMNQLLRALPPWACLVLVGDVDQLPSVGPGNVLADLIASECVPVVRLTEVFRQAGQSHIVRAAHMVREGQLPESAPSPSGDFFFIETTVGSILERVTALMRERIPTRFGLDPMRDIQVLTPMNRSDFGARSLNQHLQEVLNPARGGAEVQRLGWTYRIGDKVIQTVNNYQKEVFNGDIGRVTAIDLEEQELTVLFEGQAVRYDFGELDELSLAYALTIHKSQGSEYPAVVLPLHTQHFMMLQRNLLYTAITRARKLVVVVGSRRALEIAVQRQDTVGRYSALARRLRDLESGGAEA